MNKVLHIVSCLEKGGTEQFIMNLYRNIDRKKYQFDFYVLNPKNISNYEDEIKELGGKIIRGCLFNFYNIRKAIRNLRKAIKENGPYEAVHSHLNLGNAWPMFAAKRENVKNRISHAHAIFTPYKKVYKRIYGIIQKRVILKCSTVLCACSKEAAQTLYGKNSLKRTVIIKNGIEVEKFLCNKEPIIDKRYYFLNNYKCIWGNITRFDDNKNQLFILDCFNYFLKYEPESILILGGVDGGNLEVVREKANKIGLEDKVIFIGEQKEVNRWLNIIDIYIFPSKSEGFGIALLEAEVAGCQCFASTAVPKSVDIGLGTLEYFDLKLGPETWAKQIAQKRHNFFSPLRIEIEQAISKNKLSIKDTVQVMGKIYEKK